jgi:hypothetical protein
LSLQAEGGTLSVVAVFQVAVFQVPSGVHLSVVTV